MTPTDPRWTQAELQAGAPPHPLLTHLRPPELWPQPPRAEGDPQVPSGPQTRKLSLLPDKTGLYLGPWEPFPMDPGPLPAAPQAPLPNMGWEGGRAGRDLQPDMHPGGMPALDLRLPPLGPRGSHAGPGQAGLLGDQEVPVGRRKARTLVSRADPAVKPGAGIHPSSSTNLDPHTPTRGLPSPS